MAATEGSSFWDAVRTWADEAGLLLPSEDTDPPRPHVPQSVCDSCPICQAAATLDQVNPQVIIDMTEVARSVIAGLGSALASAAAQRDFRGATVEPVDSLDEWDRDAPGDEPGTDDPDLGG